MTQKKRHNRYIQKHAAGATDDPLRVREYTDIQQSPYQSDTRIAGRVVTEADISRDYVASSFMAHLPILQALPHVFDDLTKEFGVEVYERMAYDSECAANIDVMTLASCINPPRFVSPIPADDPRHDRAVRIVHFFEWMFRDMRVPFNNSRQSIVDSALKFGSAVAELDFKVKEYEGIEYLVVDAVRPKEIKETAFVVDGYRSIVGIIPTKIPNLTLPIGSYIPLSWQSDGLQAKDKLIKHLLPRAKFMILTWRPKADDPRGSSALRPAYTAWYAKQQILNEFLSWLARFAQPSLWATTAPDALPQCITLPDGREIRTEPTEVLLQALLQFKNASVMALPHGSQVNTIDVTGSGDIFLNGVDWANKEIARAILKQHLATGEGQHQARASSEVHQDVLSLIIVFLKNWQAESIRRDIVIPLTIANFGDAELAPIVDLGDGDGFPITSDEVARLKSSGYLSDDQLAALDKILGLPVRKT